MLRKDWRGQEEKAFVELNDERKGWPSPFLVARDRPLIGSSFRACELTLSLPHLSCSIQPYRPSATSGSPSSRPASLRPSPSSASVQTSLETFSSPACPSPHPSPSAHLHISPIFLDERTHRSVHPFFVVELLCLSTDVAQLQLVVSRADRPPSDCAFRPLQSPASK